MGGGHVVAAKPLSTRLPDPYDKPFLEVALEEKAKCLFTGNLMHCSPKKNCNMYTAPH